MNDDERKFLLAVERGDINSVRSLMAERFQRRLNINCCDPLARTALSIAIDNENLEMVKLLIEAGIKIGDSLLYAIKENFVEAVELLLDHEETIQVPGGPHSWDINRENSTFSPDMTPLILAAHENNFEIIKILLDRRISPLPDPHDPRCHCKRCSLAREEDCLKHSRARINAYTALASPCLIALSSPDPLLAAFTLSAKLESLAKLEPEYKEDYLRLRGSCQNFATSLLDHTRTSKELEILLNYDDESLDDRTELDRGKNSRTYHANNINQDLNHHHHFRPDGSTKGSVFDMSSIRTDSTFIELSPFPDSQGIHGGDSSAKMLTGGSENSCGDSNTSKEPSRMSVDSVTGRHESYQSYMRLARLKLAIQCKQKTFCAHPNIQELLASMWYENLPGFRRRNPVAQTIQVFFIGLMFPIYSIAYLVAPQSNLGRYIKKPFIKFICHSASYITFLVVLILASQRVEAFYSWDTIKTFFVAKVEFEPSYGELVEISLNASAHAHLVDATNASHWTNDNVTDIATNHSNEYHNDQLLRLHNYSTLNLNNSHHDNKAQHHHHHSRNMSSARGLESLAKIFKALPASSKRRGALPSPIELVILIWVISLIWAEAKQLRILGINYYRADMWNALDSVASGFYVGTIILRLVSYFDCEGDSDEMAREHWAAYDPILLSEGLFAAATIFSALKLVYIFSVNPYLGPLQISIGRMFVDILRFSWIYMLVLFSFACGMNQLLWYYADLEHHKCMENSLGDESCRTWRYFSNVFESTQTLFWANFGLVDLENFDLTGIKQYTRFWALLMFGCYCFINVIVALNLLVAMMNHSYEKISRKSDIEWKFARTRLWMSYFDTGSTVPAPFNILPSFKSMAWLFAPFRIILCLNSNRKRPCPAKPNRNNLKASYRYVMRDLVRRYLLSGQRIAERKLVLTEAKLNRWSKLNTFGHGF